MLLATLLTFTAGTARWIVWPAHGAPNRTDAIVMLAGPGSRMPVALRLAREHRAPVLVVSRGHLGYGSPCPPAAAAPGVKILCFEPDPADTRGEAEYVARMAGRYGWRSVTLVMTPEQSTRARIMLRRCYQGAVYTVITDQPPLSQWAYQVAYGWGALVKALVVQRAC